MQSKELAPLSRPPPPRWRRMLPTQKFRKNRRLKRVGEWGRSERLWRQPWMGLTSSLSPGRRITVPKGRPLRDSRFVIRIRGQRVAVVEVLQKSHAAIVAACARYNVARLEAFGSALRQDFKPGESDLDFLVDFRPMEPYARVESYFGLLEELRSLLQGNIDLVMVGAVKNPYLARDIERPKQLLYAA